MLGFGFDFPALATRDGLVALDRLFLDRLAAQSALQQRLLAARAAPDELDA